MFTELEQTFTTNDPATLLTKLAGYYDPNRDWFVGAHVLLRGWEVRAVFNDPVLYGLEITCTVDAFNGLLLEILYQKLGDGLGVYYGALTLPAKFRTIQLGVVSLTLPSFKIWIYTNGDFKVSVGWPLGPNSIGIQFYIFTGGGGFYFAKLRSGDNPSSTRQQLLASGSVLAQDVQAYNPILEFGLGAWFGLGRSINSGPFSAELSLVLQGTFQGLLAWQAPPAPSGQPPPTSSLSRAPDYYWFAASVSVIGTLQGAVDLKVVKLSVFIRLSVTASLALETSYASQVTVSASVQVQASLKILFVTISVGFSTTITESFQIASGNSPAASVNGPNNPAFAGMNDWTRRGPQALEQRVLDGLQAPSRLARAVRAPRALPLPPADPTKIQLGFLLQPSAVYSGSTGTASAIASLTIGAPASTPSAANADTPLEQLLAALGSWLLRTYSTDGHWDSVVSALGEGDSNAPAGWPSGVYAFLEQEIRFVLNPVDLATEAQVAFFPMFSDLSLTSGSTTINFSQQALTPADYPDAVADYFAALSLATSTGPQTDQLRESGADGPPLADFIFDDYLLTLARQLAKDNAAGDSPDPTAIAANVGGLSSRYLLSGLRLPNPTSVPPTGPIDPTLLVIDCGYALTGQQFALDAGADSADSTVSTVSTDTVSATLRIGPHPSPLAQCLSFAGGGDSVTSTMPVAPLPPAPAPIWSGPGHPAADATITIEAVPAAESAPRIVAARTRLPWSNPTGDRFLVPLPPAVLAETAAQPIQLGVTTDSGDAVAGQPALLIPLTAHLVDRTRNADVAGGVAESPYAPYVYRLDGTDDDTRDRIEALLNAAGGLAGASLQVLYNAPHSGYRSDELGGHPVLIAKTNLSTTSQPEAMSNPLRLVQTQAQQPDLLGPTQAPLTEVADFLRLLWELSVVRSGGTYLYYRDAVGQGLPGEIFCPPGQAPVGGVPTGDTASLTFAVVFPASTTFRQWHNAIAADVPASYEGTLQLALATAGGAPIQDLSPAYPPGCFAFTGEWAEEHLLRGDAAISLYGSDWVSQLYHLIQFQLGGSGEAAGPSFDRSLWSLALTPTEDARATEVAGRTVQNYRQVVPAYRFLSEPEQRTNPYAAVGGTPALTLRLLDVFGNALDSDTFSATFDLRYNDPLWSPSEWPGVRIAYRFAGTNTAAELHLNLEFDPKAIVGGSGTAALMVHGIAAGQASERDQADQQLRVALQQYALITGQLADPHTTASLTCSVLPSLAFSAGLASSLLDFAQAIVTDLGQALAGGGTLQPQSTTIKVGIDPGDLVQASADILPLQVELTLSRPADLVYTDPQGRQVDRSQQNRSSLAADLDPPPAGTRRAQARAAAEGTEPPVDVGLNQFAADFEAVFLGFDGAVAPPGQARLLARSDSAGPGTGNTPFLWVLRWSARAGADVQLPAGEAAYFALAPLALNLDGGPAQVPSYGSDPSQPTYTTQTFAGIDLDAWAQAFLAAFDDVLSPASATAVAAADPAGYQQLMLAKQVLAQCLGAGVVPVYGAGAPAGDLAVAQDHLEQAALSSLSAAWGTATIVEVPATVSTVGGDGPAGMASRLFGGVVSARPGVPPAAVDPAPASEVSLSSAKLPLVPAGAQSPAYLTFSVAVADAAQAANLDLALSWCPRFAEHLTGGVAEYGYQPSEWLRVVRQEPGGALDFELGTLSVPIPERRYPSVPVLGGQTASQSRTTGLTGRTGPADLTSPPADDPLAPYLRWDYGAGLTMPELAAQDSLWLDITYNLPVTAVTALFTDPEPTLFQALASFTAAWPQLWVWLAGVLAGQSDPDPVKVVEAYLAQVKLVARAWARECHVPDPWATEPTGLLNPVRSTPPPAGQTVRHYQLGFQDAFTDRRLSVYAQAELDGTGACDPAGLLWPLINGQAPSAGSIAAVCTPPTAGCAGAPTDEPCWYRAEYDFDPPAPGQASTLHLSWPALDVRIWQTAKLDCWVTRNSRLSGDHQDIATNPAFVYRTPTVSFASSVVPSITVPPLGPLPAQASLSATLASALAAIAQAGTAASSSRLVKVALDYSFALPGGAGVRVSNSILLADQVPVLPDAVRIDAGAGPSGPGAAMTLAQLCDELDSNARVWFEFYRPSTAAAILSVYLVLFAEVANAQLPVVQLERLDLDVPAGWWPSP